LGSFGADYLSRRILRTDLSLPLRAPFIHIQPIAARLALEDEEAVRDERYSSYVKLLCAKAVHYYHFPIAKACLPPAAQHEEEEYSDHHRDYNILAAAACIDKPSIIETFDIDEQCLGTHSKMFGDPFELAIEGGHSAALDLLLSKTTSRDTSDLLAFACHQNPTDMALVQKLLPEKWNNTYLDADNKEVTYLEANRGRNMTELKAALRTPSVEAFNFLMRIKAATTYPELCERCLAMWLKWAARKGWYAMVQHLLGLGASPNIGRGQPLSWACLHGHASIVELLLDHGANFTGREISWAAEKGRWGLVKLLVARGADINSGDPPPLVAAVASERADVVTELVSLGARVDGELGQMVVDRAKKDGLESMLALLKEIKVEGL
jgi:hypothetical protein